MLNSIKKVPLVSLIMCIGWIVWEGLDFYLWNRLGRYDVDLKLHVYFKLCEIFISIFLTSILYLLYARFRKWNFPNLAIILSVLTLSLLMGYFRILANQLLGYFILKDAVLFFFSKVMLINSVNFSLLFLVFSSVYFLIYEWQALRTEKEKLLKANALAHEAQLGMLRYQLNPHFLFNALNSIRSMISEDPKKARRIVTELSEFFRYTLINTDEKEVTLGLEIEAIQNYLEIQKIRFEDKIEIQMDIDPEAEAARIPCFLIHPLLENAIKYGMKTSPAPLKIQVVAIMQHSSLIVRISNTGQIVHSKNKDDQTVGTGTGLRNIKKRLELAYPDRFSFQMLEDDGWVHVSIMVDLEENG